MSRGRRKPQEMVVTIVSVRREPSTREKFDRFWGRFDQKLLKHFGLDEETLQREAQLYSAQDDDLLSDALLDRSAGDAASPSGGAPSFPRSLPDPDEPEDMVAQKPSFESRRERR